MRVTTGRCARTGDDGPEFISAQAAARGQSPVEPEPDGHSSPRQDPVALRLASSARPTRSAAPQTSAFKQAIDTMGRMTHFPARSDAFKGKQNEGLPKCPGGLVLAVDANSWFCVHGRSTALVDAGSALTFSERSECRLDITARDSGLRAFTTIERPVAQRSETLGDDVGSGGEARGQKVG